MSDFLKEIQAELEQVKQDANREGQRVADLVYENALEKLSQRSIKNAEEALGVKTGRLKQSLKRRVVVDPMTGEVSFEVYFDSNVAPHAKWVIQGTRKMKPHPILENAVSSIEEE